MSQSSNAPLVRIPTPGPNKAPLSKTQQAFNDFTQRIAELEEQITHFRSTTTVVHQRIQTEYLPLLHEYYRLQTTLLRVLDRAHDRPDTSRAEQRKLASVIRSMVGDLIADHESDDLRSIADKYDVENYEEAVDAPPAQPVKELPPAVWDENVPPQPKEQKRTGSARKQARAAKKELEARNITKAVRTLYMDLVKAFHPDREPDEAEKERKTEIMQRVTGAYEKSDLLALLRLQLEYNQIDQQQLERIADEQISYYNTILKQQVAELSGELSSLQTQLADLLGKATPVISVTSAELMLNQELNTLKKARKALKKDISDLSDPAILKAWLKTYKA